MALLILCKNIGHRLKMLLLDYLYVDLAKGVKIHRFEMYKIVNYERSLQFTLNEVSPCNSTMQLFCHRTHNKLSGSIFSHTLAIVKVNTIYYRRTTKVQRICRKSYYDMS